MGLKPGYKQTEVGVIPEEWEVSAIGEVAVVEGGYAFSSRMFLPSGKYQIVKMSNLYGGNLDLERSASFINSLSEQQKPFLLHHDEIIITLTGTTGKRDYGYSYKIDREENLLLNQRVGRIVVRGNSDPTYIAFQLRTPCFLDQFFEVSKGGTGNQTNVGTQDVAAMRIPMPPIPEQRAIGAALSDVDGLLTSLEAAIAKKREIKQAAMQQLLTGKTRLPGFSEAKVRYKETEVGVIPEDWEVKALNEIADVKGGKRLPVGKTLSDDGTPYPYIRVSDMFYGGVSLQEIKYVPTDVFPLIRNYRIFKDDIFITVAGTLGIVGKVPPELDGANLTENADKITNIKCDKNYLLYTLLSPRIQNIVDAQKTVGAQPKLALTRIQKFLIPLPKERAEQQAIAAVLSDMDAEIAALEQRRDKTQTLKQGMMQELLTGKTRLV